MPTELQTTNAHSRAPRRSGGLPIHVLLVDDHPAIRRGVRQMISEQHDLQIIAESASATEAVGELARWADVAIIDYHLGGRDGLWLTRQIKRRERPPRVLIYSAFADHALTVAAILAGADGLLSKQALDDELCVTIRRLAHGRRHLPAVPAPLTRALRARLEPQDHAIFDLLIHGLDPREITARLQITPAELDTRRQAMLQAIAPHASHRQMPVEARSPLDYDRRRRSRGHRAS